MKKLLSYDTSRKGVERMEILMFLLSKTDDIFIGILVCFAYDIIKITLNANKSDLKK
jgi:hypothetical protein